MQCLPDMPIRIAACPGSPRPKVHGAPPFAAGIGGGAMCQRMRAVGPCDRFSQLGGLQSPIPGGVGSVRRSRDTPFRPALERKDHCITSVMVGLNRCAVVFSSAANRTLF